VQNLFNLDNYLTDQDKRLGQVKLTMAKFFRIDGESTQLRGVVPDIELPSYGEPSEYGESALDYAMEWSRIDELAYEPLADLTPLLPQARERHAARRESDDALKSLIEDFRRYEELDERTTVSLIESVRAEEQAESEARRAARFAHAGVDAPSEGDAADASGGDDDAGGGEGEADGEAGEEAAAEEDEPDVLLTESARILADLIELDQEQHRLVQVQEPVSTSSLH
jgi:carboxyl-terminal processing protease